MGHTEQDMQIHELNYKKRILKEELQKHKEHAYNLFQEYHRVKALLTSSQEYIKTLESKSTELDMEIETIRAGAQLEKDSAQHK